MKFQYLSTIFLLAFVLQNTKINAQCVVQKEISPTGVYIETTEKELIYFNNEYSLFARSKHDGDNFFLILIAKPIVKKDLETGSMRILLENKDTVQLEFYDINYRNRDSSINILYKIEKDQLKILTEVDIKEIYGNINLKQKDFILKLHKDIIRNQLKCLSEARKE